MNKTDKNKWKTLMIAEAIILALLIPGAVIYCSRLKSVSGTNTQPADLPITEGSFEAFADTGPSDEIKIVGNISEISNGTSADSTFTFPAAEDSSAVPTEPTAANIPDSETSLPADKKTEASETVSTGAPTAAAESTAATTAPTAAATTAPTAAVTPTTAPAVPNTGSYLLTYAPGNSWEAGNVKMATVEFNLTNQSGASLDKWTLVLTIDGLDSCEGWGGNFKKEGNLLTVTNMDYNGSIFVGGSVSLGGNFGTASDFKITSAALNGVPCAVNAGTVNKNVQNNPNQNPNNQSSQPAADTSALLKRSSLAVQGDDWLHTDGNKILDKDGKQVWLTGVNWFGYNTGTNIFDGLWASRFEPTVKAIADHGFNLIRVPISAELINQWASGQYPKANYNNAYNETLNSLNSLEIFDYFLKLAEENGIKVMPDIHSAETNASGHNVNLWCTSKITVNDYYAALEWMADRYKDNDTIIAFDLKNEPHGKPNEGANAAIWNNSTAANNWKYVAETAAKKVLAKNPNVLVLVEGIEIYPMNSKGDYSSTNSKDYYFNWWGGNLRGVADYPINLGAYQNKLVYSPHDYGPTVYNQPWFDKKYTYASLMKDCWHDNWFYIHEQNLAPLLIGEWGGFMTEPNITWMTYMRQLISTYHLNHTFWCLNANSGDTGGLLLDDFTTWDDAKYSFVKQVLWQENGKFVGLDHAIKLGENGITLSQAKGLK